MPDSSEEIEICRVDPGHADAQRCFEAYFADIEQRASVTLDPATRAAARPDDLRPPAGALLVVYRSGEPVGCGAVKHHAGEPSDIKRMWVSPTARGRGLARRLLGELESLAAAAGATAVRLETNRNLTEAIAMYRSSGYSEVAPFNEEPFAHHWFEKRLGPDD
jgi:ribosomal protein S18 acetylase RimI-like enzyme